MKPVVLVILDGWGWSLEQRGNAIAMAQTPILDTLRKNFPFTLLQASGISVGLPWAEPGNSKVGHTSIGTGQVRYQPLTRISRSIQAGDFFKNQVLLASAEHVKERNSSFHIMGLLGSGSVHSYLDHLWAMLEFVQKQNLPSVYLHLFLDGRDSPPKEGVSLVAKIITELKQKGISRLSTLIGRHYAMDRDLGWENTAKAYRLITEGIGEITEDPVAALKTQYTKSLTDEYIEPIVIKQKEDSGLIKANDALVFFNFREDSARQLTRAFQNPASVEGARLKKIDNLFLVTMTEYEKGLTSNVVYLPVPIRYTLSGLVAQAGKRQFKIAETEKYAHVTYFFNGGKEEMMTGEERKIISSEKVTDFAATPKMKAPEIAKELVLVIGQKKYDFILANFANADMLAHTGDIASTVKGVEVIDEAVGTILHAVLELDGALVITADHGNAEQMISLESGSKLTEHSKNPVPFWLVANKFKKEIVEDPQTSTPEISGILPDVTATILELLDIPVPPDMDGRSLLPN